MLPMAPGAHKPAGISGAQESKPWRRIRVKLTYPSLERNDESGRECCHGVDHHSAVSLNREQPLVELRVVHGSA
jgi:hypothetical protein